MVAVNNNDLVGAAFKEAGYTCRGCMAHCLPGSCDLLP